MPDPSAFVCEKALEADIIAASIKGSVKGPGKKRMHPGKMPMPSLQLGGGKFNLRLPGRKSQSDDAQHTGRPALSPRSGSGSGPLRSPRGEQGEETLQPANPFFDNIRQNLELSHGGITERIPLSLPPDVRARAAELPAFLRDLVEKQPEEAAATLAKEFESVERDEQRRLQGIMEWHSKGCKHVDDLSRAGDADVSPTDDEEEMDAKRAARQLKVFPQDLKRMTRKGEQSETSAWRKEHAKEPQTSASSTTSSNEGDFPFSITAGVERGSKNRYKNIWPYDFSRVRLTEPCRDDGSDYINANFIQPHGTNKRYIATQGPLDATFQDFWTLVWEQDVHVIVMLTKQFEGGSIKCGKYWLDGTYGPLTLELISMEGEQPSATPAVVGFDFQTASPSQDDDVPPIKRHFFLSHADHPQAGKRRITQVQSLSWPDFDVPSDPRTVLHLLKDVDTATEELAVYNSQDSPLKPPVLVHCEWRMSGALRLLLCR